VVEKLFYLSLIIRWNNEICLSFLKYITDDPTVQTRLQLLDLFKPEKCWHPVINTLVNSEVNRFQRHLTVSVKTRSKTWMTSPPGTIRLPINQFY